MMFLTERRFNWWLLALWVGVYLVSSIGLVLKYWASTALFRQNIDLWIAVAVAEGFGAIVLLCVLVAQWVILRRYLAQAWLWIVMSLGGWLVVNLIGYLQLFASIVVNWSATQSMSYPISIAYVIVMSAISGAIVGGARVSCFSATTYPPGGGGLPPTR
ncbi:MAG: hypothetical protein HC876_16950 [Chloroflexaceae bacterium]|nr:hypothetical protein [Chloroflexaceae bacterium]